MQKRFQALLSKSRHHALVELFLLLPYTVPTAVQMLVITDMTTGLVATWQEPLEPNGNVTYTTNTVCRDLRSGATVFSDTVVMLASQAISVPRTPFTLCEVTVTPRTSAGSGPNSTATFETPEEGEGESYR